MGYKIINPDGTETEIEKLEDLDVVKNVIKEKDLIAEEKAKLEKKDMDFGKFTKKSQEELDKMSASQLQAYREKELAEERSKGLENEISMIKNQNKQFVLNSTLQQFGLSAEQAELVKKNMAIIANDTERGINEETPEGIFKKVELAVNMLGVPKQDFSTAGSYSSGLAFQAPQPKAFLDTPQGQEIEKKFMDMAGRVDPEKLSV